jgi:hypothetical protein
MSLLQIEPILETFEEKKEAFFHTEKYYIVVICTLIKLNKYKLFSFFLSEILEDSVARRR